MQRRKFLKLGIQSTVIPSLFTGISAKAFGNASLLNTLSAVDNDHVLVLIQLAGGNDGLNTIIPVEIYGRYSAVRSNIAIPQASVLPLQNYDKAGFHPALTGLQTLFNEEKLTAIQSVGYPSADGSHFRSMDVWLTGSDAKEYLNTGWVGRFLHQQYPNFPVGFPNDEMPDPLAIQIGSTLSPAFLSANGFTALAIENDLDLYNLINAIEDPAPNTPSGNEITYLRSVARQTNKYREAIINAASKVTQQYSGYPTENSLAAQLKAVARLIGGGLKTKIYMVSIGGFDTHGGQVNNGDTTTGTHSVLLKKVSEAITAFMKDIEFLNVADRVMGMTFSEFGRRIQSNGSLGTDHGAAQPVFLFGKHVTKGILGKNPDIPANMQAIDNVPMQYDYRSIYATILRDWFCLQPEEVNTILLKEYQYLPLIKSTACIKEMDVLNNLGTNLIINYPNPFVNSTNIKFKTEGGQTLIQIFDTTGRLIKVLVDQVYTAGTYTISFDTSYLSPGLYYARLQNGPVQQVRPMLKMRG